MENNKLTEENNQPFIEENKFYDDQGIVERRRNTLPHWHQDGKLQFVTFRLNDSLPQTVLAKMEQEKENWIKRHPKPWSEVVSKEYFRRFTLFVDLWLDADYGSCVLRQEEISDVMEHTLLYFNGQRYILHDYVIMPNHVHVLLEVLSGYKLYDILHSWKSFSAGAINKLLKNEGVLWRRESFDRLVRDERHYIRVKEYILKNIRSGGIKWMKR